MDIDAGPWQNLAAVFPPHAVIPSRKLLRRHLYYSDSEPRPNAQKRKLYGCQVDVRGQSGYVALWHPEAVLEAAEKPLQGVLFPSELFWPEKSAQEPPQPPRNPPAPPVGEPRDGPLNDAYPLTRWTRRLEVVKAWAYDHAREYSDRDRFHTALREYAETRATEMPDLTDFWDRSTNDPAKVAFYVEATRGECGGRSTRTTGDGMETLNTTLRHEIPQPFPCEPLASPRKQSGLTTAYPRARFPVG